MTATSAGLGPAAAQTGEPNVIGPIRFEEAEFPLGLPIHGLQITTLDEVPIPATVSFQFLEQGVASTGATVSAGPGSPAWVEEPGIEGPTAGELLVQTNQPIWEIGFGIALSALNGEPDAVSIEAIDAAGVGHASSFDTFTTPGGFAGTLVQWPLPEPASTIRIRFTTAASRFLLDDLLLGLEDPTPPEPDTPPLLEEANRFRVVSGPAGDSFATWRRPAFDGGSEILGALLETPNQLATQSRIGHVHSAGAVASAVDADGVAWFAWNDRDSGAATVARFDGALRPLNVVVRETPTPQPTLVLGGGSGSPELFWMEEGGLWVMPLGPTGAGLEEPLRLLEINGANSYRAVGLGPFGRAIAWLDPARRLVVSWLSRTGTLRTQRIVAENVREFQITPLPNGHSALAWTIRQTSSTDVFVQRFGPSGTPRGMLSSLPTLTALNLQLIGDGAGGFGALWQGRAADLGEDAPFGISGVFYDRAGDSVQQAPRIWVPANAETGALRLLRSAQVERSGALTIYYGEDGSDLPDAVWAASFDVDLEAETPLCRANENTLCLGDGRFRVTMSFDIGGSPTPGRARSWRNDSGMFWAFDADNIEIVCKVLDGRQINGHFWVFFASLSDLGFELRVEDMITGLQRSWTNPAGRFASVGDTRAIPSFEGDQLVARPSDASAQESQAAWHGLQERSGRSQITQQDTILLGADQRFEASVRFTANDALGLGQPIVVSDDTGAFWFFQESNLELIVKVLDGRHFNGHHWVYYGSLSNVAFELEVVDRLTGRVRTYNNPGGSFASRGDPFAFPDDAP